MKLSTVVLLATAWTGLAVSCSQGTQEPGTAERAASRAARSASHPAGQSSDSLPPLKSSKVLEAAVGTFGPYLGLRSNAMLAAWAGPGADDERPGDRTRSKGRMPVWWGPL